MTGAPLAERLERIRSGDTRALSQAITLIESHRAEDLERSQELLAGLDAAPGGHAAPLATRIGITGIPGVGKSTFIDVFGRHLTSTGLRVAVLAVDPSSTVSGGSILGDKTRMEMLARDPRAFIRPSPGGTATGGVARRTREAVLLCEAAGFDVVIVETIGVGQSEVAVADMVDTFVLLLLAGAGDELQGIKRGVMELADLLVIHKADGDQVDAAVRAQQEYHAALQLLPRRHAAWPRQVLTASSRTDTGVVAVFTAVQAQRAALGEAGLRALRQEQTVHWFDATVRELLWQSFQARPGVARDLPMLREAVRQGTIPPTRAALQLLQAERG